MRLRVLQVEDNPVDAHLVLRSLQAGGLDVDALRVETADEFRAALEEPWDVVLCDHTLPAFGSDEAIRILCESGLDVPLIIVSGVVSGEKAADLMRQGARDYVSKQRLERLVPAVVREVGAVRVRLERAEARRAVAEKEAQLLHAQRLESIGRLAGGVAHDFNNLLMVISGYCQMMLPEVDPGSVHREQIEEILRAGDRAAHLTRQLLAFSRKQSASPRTTSLDGIVRGIEKMLRRVLGEDRALERHADPAAPSVYVDPGLIEQVLMNLVVNARDATAPGGRVVVTVAPAVIRPRDIPPGEPQSAGLYACLQVSDSGRGMDPDALEHAFEPFFTTKGPEHGTGLGLSTVHGIVHQSGGFIRLESQLGLGTTFRLYFPESKEPEQADDLGAQQLPPPGGDEGILVVEDDEGTRRFLAHLLEDHGYHAHEAGDGVQALARLEDTSLDIDLVLADLVMPRLGGVDLAQAIAKRHPHVPVVFMSGYGEASREASGPVALEPFLEKPVMPRRLLTTVRRTLEGRSPPPTR